MDFRLALLGGFGLVVDGKRLKFATRKESSLYAYLTLHQERGAIRRERLAGLLWPDVDEHRARRNLSTALWRIKVALDKSEAGSLAPQTSGEAVGIKLDPNAVDALKFQWLLEDSERHVEADRILMLEQAESIYSGDLLDEFEDEWCEEVRWHLRAQYVNVLRKLSAIHKNQAEYGRAAQFTQKLVRIEPLDEDSNKELMLLFHLSGDRHAALNQYEVLRKNLKDELGIEPNESTSQLWEYIRTSAPDTSVNTRPRERGNAISTDPRIPLIGRQQYVSTILERIQNSVGGRGSAVLVSGEAGIGKTKLVETLATEARLRDLQILQGRCPELQNPPPYQVIFQALWPRVMEAIRTEDSGSLLGAIVKVLSSENAPPKPTVRKLEPALNTTIVMEAILELFRTDSARKPTLLILEDIHRIDQASLTLLATLLDRLPSMPLVVLATIRPDEKKADEIIPALTANGALHLSLQPLDESELQRLVRAILRDKSVSRELLSFVWDRTDGVPLFALELVDFMTAGGHIHKASSGIWELRDRTSAIPDEFPSRVNEVIRRRIDLLDRQSKKTLVAAAILGIEFNLKHLVAITALSENTIAENLNRLIDHRLVVEFEDRLRFRHETIRAVALEMLTAEKRSLLHLRAGTILDKTGSSQPEDLYIHFLEADRRDKALIFAEASGDKARSVHANVNAVAWYSKTIELLESTNSPASLPKDRIRKKVQILIKRHEVLEVLGDPNRLDHIDYARDITLELDDKRLLARVEYLRARTISRSGNPGKAVVPAETACKLYHEISDLRGEATATEILGEIYLYQRNHNRAKGRLDRAIHLFREAGDRIGEARGLVTRSMVLLWEDLREALVSLKKAEALLGNSEEYQIRAKLLFQRGVCYRLIGQGRKSDSSLRAGLSLARRVGDRILEARALVQLAVTLSVLGRHAEAIREARHSLRLARQTNDNRTLLTGLNNIAYCAYRLSGALRHAKASAINAVRLVESMNPNENPAMYLDTLATIMLEHGDLEPALQVALQAKRLCSRRRSEFVRGDVCHHLGAIYLARKESEQAIHCLQEATRIFHANGNSSDQLLATASLVMALVEKREVKLATTYADQISRMMREVDGIEQVQLVLWSQYRAYLAAGRLAEARRALNKAYDAILTQAGSLKGRNRHRFLSNLRINRIILAEVAEASPRGNQISSIIDSRASTTTGSN